MSKFFVPTLETNNPITLSEKDLFLLASQIVLDKYLDKLDNIGEDVVIKRIFLTYSVLESAASNFNK